jgi:hypothetical protein
MTEQCSGISIVSLEMGRVTLTNDNKGNYSLSVAENSHLGANSCYADQNLPAYLQHNGRVTRLSGFFKSQFKNVEKSKSIEIEN